MPAAEKIGELEVDELDALPFDLRLEFRDRGKDVTTPLFSIRSEDARTPRKGARARISNIFDDIPSIKD